MTRVQDEREIREIERRYREKPFSDKQEIALEKLIPKIKLVGWNRDPIEIESLEVDVTTEGYVWLRMVDKDGKHYDTGYLKESV